MSVISHPLVLLQAGMCILWCFSNKEMTPSPAAVLQIPANTSVKGGWMSAIVSTENTQMEALLEPV